MPPTPTTILILAEGPEAARWADALRTPETQVWLKGDAVTQPQRPEIVVTDDPATDVKALGHPDDLAVVKIGVDGPADVHLPWDCTARELQLARELLTQIVRLRRQEREAAEVQRELSIAASTDALTGLANRRAWDAALSERLAKAKGRCRRLCLAIVDLDHFKQVNDTFGHVLGDRVLQETGRAIGSVLRHDDLVARLGGDEFGLLLWVDNESMAAAIIERVQAGVVAHLATTETPHVTASAGYVLTGVETGPGGPTAEALYMAADAALQDAKRQGRNRTVASRP
jgi:diguanylate cyclase (GGDEF)-like protein